MKKYKGRLLSWALAAVMVVTCVIPGIAFAAEPAEANTSSEAFTAAAEVEPVRETEEEEAAASEEEVTAEGSEAKAAEDAAEEETHEADELSGDPEGEQEA